MCREPIKGIQFSKSYLKTGVVSSEASESTHYDGHGGDKSEIDNMQLLRILARCSLSPSRGA